MVRKDKDSEIFFSLMFLFLILILIILYVCPCVENVNHFALCESPGQDTKSSAFTSRYVDDRENYHPGSEIRLFNSSSFSI